VNNKTTILEHLTKAAQNKGEVRDTLIEEYSKYDKDLKLLTFRILLEKFNSKYNTLLPEQKNILREFITSVDSSTKLRSIVNEEIKKLLVEITKLRKTSKDDIIKIKLQEVLKNIRPLSNKEKVTDSHLVDIMQYYELIKELREI
jgi:TRAP-type mannitol/chloroaromatic compound transport system substrate-binding protein